MCVHNWFGYIPRSDDGRLYMRCGSCAAVVSFASGGGRLHANVHAELGPLVGWNEVQALFQNIVAGVPAGRAPGGNKKKRQKRKR
jgi:hypothetical protein